MHSFTDSNGKRWTACAECNRGGNGNDKDKCACGWQVIELNGLGCFMGTEIVGGIQRQRPPKLTRSQKNYKRFLNIDPGCSFAEWMGFGRYKRPKPRSQEEIGDAGWDHFTGILAKALTNHRAEGGVMRIYTTPMRFMSCEGCVDNRDDEDEDWVTLCMTCVCYSNFRTSDDGIIRQFHEEAGE